MSIYGVKGQRLITVIFYPIMPSPIAQSVGYRTCEQWVAGSIRGSGNLLGKNIAAVCTGLKKNFKEELQESMDRFIGWHSIT